MQTHQTTLADKSRRLSPQPIPCFFFIFLRYLEYSVTLHLCFLAGSHVADGLVKAWGTAAWKESSLVSWCHLVRRRMLEG